ncbi:hypothetical protein GO755_00150 [Spirosoma sp. HMF4905]|uniref:Uncharacterized protein n=1 Tax=Spirosoma arboris TaxID=2682092 RepID=A0A7K1S3M4_9BACT|nr:hypothetical protein [Spirosoma arboris]
MYDKTHPERWVLRKQIYERWRKLRMIKQSLEEQGEVITGEKIIDLFNQTQAMSRLKINISELTGNKNGVEGQVYG